MENLVTAILIAGVTGASLALGAGLLYLSVNARWTELE
jgi:hypothetical protein